MPYLRKEYKQLQNGVLKDSENPFENDLNGRVQVIIRRSRTTKLNTSNINTENSKYHKNITINIFKVAITKTTDLFRSTKWSSRKKNHHGTFYKSLH